MPGYFSGGHNLIHNNDVSVLLPCNLKAIYYAIDPVDQGLQQGCFSLPHDVLGLDAWV